MTGQWTPVAEGQPNGVAWEVVGSIRGPQGDSYEVLPYSMVGNLLPRRGSVPFPIAGGPFDVATVAVMVGSAPVGAPVVIDINVSGASMYADPAHQPTIPDGSRVATVGPPATTTLTDGDYVTVDIDMVGTVLPGADLTVVLRLRKAAA